MHDPRKPPGVIFAGIAVLVLALAFLFAVSDLTPIIAATFTDRF